jgi:hypothetical protein
VDGDIAVVQSRIDLHYPSDYYSGKKITVTPLNFVCKSRAPPLQRMRVTIARQNAAPKNFRQRDCAQKFRHGAEVPMECALLLNLILRS